MVKHGSADMMLGEFMAVEEFQGFRTTQTQSQKRREKGC